MNWTPKMICDQMEDAVRTLRRLPPVKVQGYFNTWPAMKHDFGEVIDHEPQPIRLRASSEAISRMEQVFDWMPWLTVEERRLLWQRGAKVRWKTISWELGCDRSTAWRRWMIALTKVSTQLNARSKERQNVSVGESLNVATL